MNNQCAQVHLFGWSRMLACAGALTAMFRRIGVFLLLVLLVGTSGCNSRGDSNSDSGVTDKSYFDVKGEYILMNGTFISATPKQLAGYLDKYPEIKTLVLQQVLGSADDEALFLVGTDLRKRGINTALFATSKIYSGGVDLFLSGVKRSMETGAILGVHAWSDGEKQAGDFSKDSPEHNLNKNYIKDMLGSEDFYWFTIAAAKADGIHNMTDAEIQKYRLINASSPSDLPEPVDISDYDI